MQKQINEEITDNVMEQIRSRKIKMRPRSYFVFGSILAFVGLTFAFVSSAFMFSILYLSVREGGRMHQYKLETLQELFHWWIPLLAVLGVVVGVWLLQRYEFSYKMNFIWVIAGFLLAVILSSVLFVSSGAYETVLQRGPMHEFVKPWQGEGYGQGQQRGLQKNDRDF